MTDTNREPEFHWPEEDPGERAREAELPEHERDPDSRNALQRTPTDGDLEDPTRLRLGLIDDEEPVGDPSRALNGGRSG